MSRINDIMMIQIQRFLDVKILLKASKSPINMLIARLRPMLNAIFSKFVISFLNKIRVNK
ncbi:hypothetical protein AUJ83_04775 [Candidatus Woesearchaeota archaeon CG1_02_33_12]|nr:MAG: hypothetical protein AUJ83_04775 [Candidatus Woesearchaeota archaeon CG1_02_33_12]